MYSLFELATIVFVCIHVLCIVCMWGSFVGGECYSMVFCACVLEYES